MKKIFVAAAIAALMVSGGANAALWCKNDKGQTLVWKVNQPKPNTSINSFDVRNERDIVCFVNSYVYYALMPKVVGVPYIYNVATTGEDGDGLIYRGDMARWLIENLPTANNQNTTKQDYNNAKP